MSGLRDPEAACARLEKDLQELHRQLHWVRHDIAALAIHHAAGDSAKFLGALAEAFLRLEETQDLASAAVDIAREHTPNP